MLNSLEFIRDIEWKEIFESWKQREASDPEWQACATRVKGWENWEAWREFMADQVGLKKRRFKLYKILDPAKSIPNWLIGPTQGWQNHFKGLELDLFERTFQVLAENKIDWLQEHEKIQGMRQHFPSPTEMIGFYLKNRDQIMCFEGHHRSAAIALAEALGEPIHLGDIYLVLTDFESEDEPLIPKMIERGSHKIEI